MNLKVLSHSSNLLSPSNKGDAGYDLISASDPMIKGEIWMHNLYKSILYIEYDTRVKLDFLEKDGKYNHYGLVFPRSSLSKYNLLLCNSVGVIDSGYKDSIKLRFKYIIQPEDLKIIQNDQGVNLPLVSINPDKVYKKGDKIGQMVFSEHVTMNIENFNNLNNLKTRGEGGFGSTGI